MKRTLLYAAGLLMVVAGLIVGCQSGGCPGGSCGSGNSYAPHGGSSIPRTSSPDYAQPARNSGSYETGGAPTGNGGGYGSGSR